MPPRGVDGSVAVEQSTIYSEKQNNSKSENRPSRRLADALTSLFGSFKLAGNIPKQANARNSTVQASSKAKQLERNQGLANDAQMLYSPSEEVGDAPSIDAYGISTLSEKTRSSHKGEAKNESISVTGTVMEQESCSLRELQQLIAQLQQDGTAEMQAKAAESIRYMAKDCAEARTTLATLGAIPPLVAILDSSNSSCQSSALLALLNLAICNDNEVAVQEAAVAAFLSLSALDANKPIIGASGAVPLFVKMLKNGSSQGKKDALRALYNLSICSKNVSMIVESGAISHILSMFSEPEVAETALALIGHMAEAEIGRKAINNDKDIVLVLSDVLGWGNAPKCQERALYLLMLVAHHSWAQRQALINAGGISALLQLVLLGSNLSQQRASRILDYLRYDRRQVRAVSAPLASGFQQQQQQQDLDYESLEITEERKVVSEMVQQSLQRSMDRLVKRACLQSLDNEQNKSTGLLKNSSSSRSLQF
ncbi:hypothetical protein O6H91_08G110800 [Diphasiastrum complanatum]|uniref:Uncharacterized protein n=1 Tax=Diphasiastrum complanatum TaxID=34168 RepID=A0ACC2D1C1_DIPCM|nr:hypothetical protein O6H91_08G110800 [Diphasiastrum complanatum]